jgi:thymidylate synthase
MAASAAAPPPPVHDELQYLALVARLITSAPRPDRTGVGTRSVFGHQLRFSLRGGTMPLLTTKHMAWRAIVEELLWFISGSTDARVLAERGVRIWDANGSRKFLDDRGLFWHREGDLGPVYGFQWRHFGAEYSGADTDYRGKGVDQLQECIRMIMLDPHSRRILMTAWNPKQLGQQALPPCHVLVQWYVTPPPSAASGDGRGSLSCMMTQRSGDVGLGVPFNIASYALLTHLVAHVCNLDAGELIISLGDAHVYETHISALREQMMRDPHPFPTVDLSEAPRDLDLVRSEHIKLCNYKAWPAISMQMAV